MNNIIRLHSGGYSYSIRTSGEVLGVIIREITVLYVSIFFIGAKLHLFFKPNAKFFVKVKFLTNQAIFVIKNKIPVLKAVLQVIIFLFLQRRKRIEIWLFKIIWVCHASQY